MRRGREDIFLINIHRFRHPVSTTRISIQIKIPEARSMKYAITVSKVTPFGGSRRVSSSFGVQKFLSIRRRIPDLLMSWILCIKTKTYFTATVRVFWKIKECILLDGYWCFGWTDWLHLQSEIWYREAGSWKVITQVSWHQH